jgi:four helix bundle protein
MKSSTLRDKSFQFAIRIVHLNQYLVETKKEYVLSKQILRAGTSPGAMIREAGFAESLHDFIHKMAIARKEISETQYWMDLLYAGDYLTDAEYQSLYSDAEEIAKMLTASIKTARNKLNNKDKI